MSDEKKVNEETTAAKKPKRWPIVVSVFAVIIIAVAVAFLHLHEEPRFCSTICHNNMTKYVDGYYSEDPSMTVTKHENADVTCLGCHWSQAKMLDLVHEVVLYVTDSYPNPLHDMKEFVNDEFCGQACHNGEIAPKYTEVTADWTIDPHKALPTDVSMHAGLEVACGDCHSIHKQSTMVCAECHDDVEVPAYWAVPVNETKAATAVTFDIYDPHGDIPGGDVVPMHEGQDFSCASCHDTQTIMCAGCHDVYIEENLPEGWTLGVNEAKAATAETYGMFDPHTNVPDTATHAMFQDCESCHAEQVLQCAMCHQDYFTEVPEGWSLPAHTNQLWPAPVEEEPADDAAESGEAVSAADVADGTYEGSGKGLGGTVPVAVTVEGGKIVEVTVGDNAETVGIGSKAIEQLPALIVEANGVEGVDAVSGATITSKAIFAGVEAALANA